MNAPQRQTINVAQKSFIPQNLVQTFNTQHANAQKVLIPPLKIQGIKSKLVPHIRNLFAWNNAGTYFEPFMRSRLRSAKNAREQMGICVL